MAGVDGDREQGDGRKPRPIGGRIAPRCWCASYWSCYFCLLALGEFGTGEEWQVIFKTTKDRYPQLEAHLIKHHEWANPEVTAVSLVSGSESYLEWVVRTATGGQA